MKKILAISAILLLTAARSLHSMHNGMITSEQNIQKRS
jgi:hypothetical protein